MKSKKIEEFFNNKKYLRFPTRMYAEEILEQLYDLIDEFGNATVADLKELCGVKTSKFSDTKWGWSSKGGKFYVKPIGIGLFKRRKVYALVTPNPQRLCD